MSLVDSRLQLTNDYLIQRSLRLDSASSAYLHRTPGGAGNQKRYTLSVWVKRCGLLASALDVGLLGAGDGTQWGIAGSGAFGASFDGKFLIRNGGGNVGYWDIEFRDPSAWYHFVLAIDTDQATPANRNRLYVNGVEQPAPTASLGLSVSTNINSTTIHSIGTFNLQAGPTAFAGYYSNAYIAEYNFIDGQQLTPSSFGFTDPNGVWKPQRYTGTYGTNGFYLNFSDNSNNTAATLGKDYSGNGNNWTPVNISVTAGAGNDSLADTPTPYTGGANFCTLSPLDTDPSRTTTVALSNGNLTASVSTYATVQYVFRAATMASEGYDYWEVTKGDSVNKRVNIGFIEEDGVRSGAGVGGIPVSSYGYGSGDTVSANTGYCFSDGTSAISGLPATDPGVSGDVVMIAHDRRAKKIWFGKNGTWFTAGGGVGNPATGEFPTLTYTTDKTLLPCIGAGSFASTTLRHVNFGQRPFTYTPPAGFRGISTNSLRDSEIIKGSSYMDVVTYTGTGSALTPTSSLSFSPDLVWIKSRSAVTDHAVYDSVRPNLQRRLETNTVDAEPLSDDNGVTALNNNGFTLGTLAQVNTNAATYVAWCWDKSATPGLDIVTYSGTLSSSGTTSINHSLGVAPAMIISKARVLGAQDNGQWAVRHKSLGNWNKYLRLQTVDSVVDATANGSMSAPTSTTFPTNWTSGMNASSPATYVAYLWAEVPGFSKFGSYTGNGLSDGPFVYCGFRPRWIMIKRTDSAANWQIYDTARDTINHMRLDLCPNSPEIENSLVLNISVHIDDLSNGFKLRATDTAGNASGSNFIYAAFAELPFKYSRAR